MLEVIAELEKPTPPLGNLSLNQTTSMQINNRTTIFMWEYKMKDDFAEN